MSCTIDILCHRVYTYTNFSYYAISYTRYSLLTNKAKVNLMPNAHVIIFAFPNYDYTFYTNFDVSLTKKWHHKFL